MVLKRKMLSDRPEAREKLLCSFEVAKATHATLTFACRLMAVLGPAVQPESQIRALFKQQVSDAYVHGVKKQHEVLLDSSPPIPAMLAANEIGGRGVVMLQNSVRLLPVRPRYRRPRGDRRHRERARLRFTSDVPHAVASGTTPTHT